MCKKIFALEGIELFTIRKYKNKGKTGYVLNRFLAQKIKNFDIDIYI